VKKIGFVFVVLFYSISYAGDGANWIECFRSLPKQKTQAEVLTNTGDMLMLKDPDSISRRFLYGGGVYACDIPTERSKGNCFNLVIGSSSMRAYREDTGGAGTIRLLGTSHATPIEISCANSNNFTKVSCTPALDEKSKSTFFHLLVDVENQTLEQFRKTKFKPIFEGYDADEFIKSLKKCKKLVPELSSHIDPALDEVLAGKSNIRGQAKPLENPGNH
jgi:hypothetical protein